MFAINHKFHRRTNTGTTFTIEQKRKHRTRACRGEITPVSSQNKNKGGNAGIAQTKNPLKLQTVFAFIICNAQSGLHQLFITLNI